jgi:hypothetical protein
MTRLPLRASVVVLAVIALAGCGRLNRAATINQTTHATGAATVGANATVRSGRHSPHPLAVLAVEATDLTRNG